LLEYLRAKGVFGGVDQSHQAPSDRAPNRQVPRLAQVHAE
jgi:hypothetical protein